MKAKYRVTYDSDACDAFNIHKPDGTIRQFAEAPNGLHYYDTAAEYNGIVLVSTVDRNKKSFTNRDYQRAVLAWKIQRIINLPELDDYIRYLDHNHLPNCPINRHDAIAAHQIFGKDIAAIKGKTTRRRPEPVLTDNRLPPAIPAFPV